VEERIEGRRGRMSRLRRETEGSRERRGCGYAFRLGIHLPFSGPVILQEAYERHGEGTDEASDVE